MAEEKPHNTDHEAETMASSAGVGGQSTEIATQIVTKIPERIGHYKLKRVIAAGGMGVVYEAIQEHPRRTVALKIMKQGIATRSALRRFEYESQILARLRHPGIAQIFEAGMHDDGSGGVPFFAMEYIAGAKDVVEFAKSKEMGTREKLELFASVCDAVHHGHQKGIIHRDLKPPNILVDSTGQPKIIDFGVARATDSDQAVTTLQTDVGQLIGTVQYMSPEQIEADPHDIDTRSDVYALGVVLYKLLTDKFPYDVTGTVIYEATRIIREQQPKRISTINNTLKGDVETIVLHALEKDRDRRYQSANELAQDIRRYMDNRTILARPPSLTYHARVFMRRNKVLVGGVVAVFLALVFGIMGISWQARIAAKQRDVAERRFGQVRTLANKFMFEFHDTIQRLDGATPARQLLVTTALEYLDGLASEASDNPELQRELASAYDRVGDIRGGVRNPSLGDSDGAMESYRKALELREAVAAGSPDDMAIRKEISASYIRIGDQLKSSGDVGGALDWYRKALAIREELAKIDPDYRRFVEFALNTTGDMLLRMGRIGEARADFTRALAIARQLNDEDPKDLIKRRDLSVSYGRMARVYGELGDHDAAVQRHQKALEIREKMVEENPDAGRYRRDVAVTHMYIGVEYLLLQEPGKAVPHLTHFLDVARQRAEADPLDARSKRDLATAYSLMGQAYIQLQQFDKAQQSLAECQAIALPLSASDPANTNYKADVAESYQHLGELAAARDRMSEAAEHFREALTMIEDLAGNDPDDVQTKAKQAELLMRLGLALKDNGEPGEATRRLEAARQLYETLLEVQPEQAGLQAGLAQTRTILSAP